MQFYKKNEQTIKRVLFIPAAIVGTGVILIAVAGMAFLGGLVCVGHVVKNTGEFIADECVPCLICGDANDILSCTHLEQNTIELYVADVEIDTTSNTKHIVEVTVINSEDELVVGLPVAITVNKQKIIPLTIDARL